MKIKKIIKYEGVKIIKKIKKKKLKILNIWERNGFYTKNVNIKKC